MAHPFMASVANDLAARDIATLRYQFPYMERGSKRPDSPKARAGHRPRRGRGGSAPGPGLPLFAGGKSFGGRMTSQAQAASPLAGVRGLVFLGFPAASARAAGDSAQRISSTCRFRCCSCRGRVTSSRICGS